MSLLVPGLTSLAYRLAGGWLRQVGRTLRALWHEITGSLFLCMGALAMPAAWREWNAYQRGDASLWRLLIVAVFMITAIGFGIGSFLRARRLK